MIIVSNITGGNAISFILREGAPIKVVLTDEVTGDVIEETPVFSILGYLTQCTISTDLSDQRRYTFVVLDSANKELYTDLIFCSTQNLADYSISNGELNTDSAPTEGTPQFIILD